MDDEERGEMKDGVCIFFFFFFERFWEKIVSNYIYRGRINKYLFLSGRKIVDLWRDNKILVPFKGGFQVGTRKVFLLRQIDEYP